MAKETECKQPDAKAPAVIAIPKDDGLIEVRKDGETTRVHPTCLTEHLKQGWAQ